MVQTICFRKRATPWKQLPKSLGCPQSIQASTVSTQTLKPIGDL